MPQHDGQSWPSVKDMVAADERLIVFTSDESKQQSEGFAYKWNFMVECKCKIIHLPCVLNFDVHQDEHYVSNIESIFFFP